MTDSSRQADTSSFIDPAELNADQPGGGVVKPEEKQSATWLELFFDLIFVTAFDQLSRHLGEDTSLHGYGVFALMFAAVWWAWVGNTLFAGRYGNACRAYRVGTTLQLLSMGGLAMGVLGDLKDVGSFFAWMFALNRFVLVGMYAQQAYNEQRSNDASEDGKLARHYAYGFGLGTLVWLASAWLPVGWQQWAWASAIGIDALVSFVNRGEQSRLLPHPEHLPERVGLLTIISLGAVITEIVHGAGSQDLHLFDQLPAISALLTTVALFKLYFDEARSLPVLLAHKDGKVGNLLLWLYAHLPLTLLITALGVALGHGITAESAKADEHERVQVALTLLGIFVNLAALRLLTRYALGELRLDLSVSALLLAGAAMIGLMFLPLSTTPYELATLAVCALTLLTFWKDPTRQKLSKTEEVLTGEDEGHPDGGNPDADHAPTPSSEN